MSNSTSLNQSIRFEINLGLDFLSQFLTPSPPAIILSTFRSSLADSLYTKYTNHWHCNDIELGSAYRSVDGNDFNLVKALKQAKLTFDHSVMVKGIRLSQDWIMWIDPTCVLVRIDQGLFSIYGARNQPVSIQSKLISTVATTPPKSSTISASSPPTTVDGSASPTKRSSRAIKITAPRHLLLPSSPFVTPPTPQRSPSVTLTHQLVPDIFSSLSTAALELSRRRSSSGTSDLSSGDEAESCGSSIFDDRTSHHSSVSSLGSYDIVPLSSSSSTNIKKVDSSSTPTSPFKYPSLPARPISITTASSAIATFSFPSRHSRSHSSSSVSSIASSIFPSAPNSPTKPSAFGAKLPPQSPSRPRYRGTRGGGGGHSRNGSTSSSTGSIVPLSLSPSTTSATVAPAVVAVAPVVLSSGVAVRTRAQALAGTLTEHSGGKVGVLGGGVLLGLPRSSTGTSGNNSTSDGESSGQSTNSRRGGGRRGRRTATQYHSQTQPHMGMGMPMGMQMNMSVRVGSQGEWEY